MLCCPKAIEIRLFIFYLYFINRRWCSYSTCLQQIGSKTIQITLLKHFLLIALCFFFSLTFYFQHIPLKDFAAEIRGGKDIKEFIHSALVLLDIQDTSISDLMEIILRRIKQDSTPKNGPVTPASPMLSSSFVTTAMTSANSGHRENLNLDEIKHALFVNDRGMDFAILISRNFSQFLFSTFFLSANPGKNSSSNNSDRY